MLEVTPHPCTCDLINVVIAEVEQCDSSHNKVSSHRMSVISTQFYWKPMSTSTCSGTPLVSKFDPLIKEWSNNAIKIDQCSYAFDLYSLVSRNYILSF